MNVENHIHNAKLALDIALDKLNRQDFDSAIALFASAYSDVRNLIELAWQFKREAAQSELSAGEDSP